MGDGIYLLRYLPLFYNDVSNATDYISYHLNNPQAAHNLLDAIERAILQRLPVAEAFEPYHSTKDRTYPYYRIYVKNYTIYYVVIDNEDGTKTMEVRRLLYKGQHRDIII